MGSKPTLREERGEERRRERRGWERGGLRIKGLTLSTVLTETDPFTLTCTTMWAILQIFRHLFIFFLEETIKAGINEKVFIVLYATIYTL